MSSPNPDRSSSGGFTPELNHEFYYALAPQEREFLRQQTGIHNDDELKAHLVAIQAKAYQVDKVVVSFESVLMLLDYSGSSITEPTLIQSSLKIAGQPVYQEVLKLGKERKAAILLDIGCCFGNDLRKAVADGFPITGVIGSDLHKDFWDMGNELYVAPFPVPFIEGNVFDAAHIDPTPPLYAPPNSPPPALGTLTSLNPLRGHVSAIHASSLFHLFDEAHQHKLADALGALLSPEPGSVIFGSHNGLHERGFKTGAMREDMFCHSPESWAALWDGGVFKKGTVRVEAEIRENPRRDPAKGDQPYFVLWLVWSVTRL
ncbi:hypothetical protein HWV62_11301 [Athelia sp. TMB]|nr:hypothetical protein HWV62_11301 [Athelia sp. TMB]